MKRILILCLVAVCLVLVAPRKVSVADDKPPVVWKTVKDFKVLKLWEQSIGPTMPQIAILQLASDDRLRELQADPLAFYKKYEIFAPQISDRAQGQYVVNLTKYCEKCPDPSVVVIVHDVGTYSAFSAFQVEGIK